MKKTQILEVIQKLDSVYGTEIPCYLEYESPWQLLFATILSAQCTDAKVNQVTRDLYRVYPTLEAFAAAEQEKMEEAVHATGFYHEKAKHLISCAKELITRFGGEVPRSMEDLTTLPGVGRKTANVIRGHIFHEDSIVVDTHVMRVSQRLGITKETVPEKIEFDLMKKLPKDHWTLYNLQIIAHGRTVCNAKKPDCEHCILQPNCSQRFS